MNKRVLAEFIHDEYKQAAVITGWTTPQNCQVPFNNLPKKKKQVMLTVAGAIITRLKEIQVEKTKEMNEMMNWMGGN